MIQGLATRWLASLPGRASHPLECTTLPGRTSNRFFRPCKNLGRLSESTDAAHRGGAARSSDKVSVMEMERRGCIVRLY